MCYYSATKSFVANEISHLTWKINIITDNLLNKARIATKITQFGDDVQLIDQTSGPESFGQTRLMFQIPPFRDLQANFHQTATWRYRLKVETSFIFEISRVDIFAVGNNSRSTASNKAHISSQWGFRLWSTTWDEVFAENLALQVGSMASWSPTLSTLFRSSPGTSRRDPRSGLDDYMKIMEDVLAVLGGVLNEYSSKADKKE